MDTNHRNRIAFLGIYSEILEQSMKTVITDSKINDTLSTPQFFFAYSR